MRGTDRLRAGEVDLVCVDGGKDDDAPPGAGDRHVEAPFAAQQIERSEVHQEASLRIGRVADGEEQNVPLVALHIFEIFDENGFLRLIVEEGLQVRIFRPLFLEDVFNDALLRNGERDDAEGMVAAGAAQFLEEVCDDGLGLGAIGAGGADAVHAVWNETEMDAQRLVAACRREGVEAAAVVFLVGKGDERFVARAVVPVERGGGESGGEALIEDALEVGFRGFGGGTVLLFVDVILEDGAREEAGGRHLAGIADDDGLPRAGNDADCVPRRDLRGFIEDEQVERLHVRLAGCDPALVAATFRIE